MSFGVTTPQDNTAPATPTNIFASQGQGRFSRIVWDGGDESDFRRFALERSTDGGSSWSVVYRGDAQLYLDDDVSWGSSYNYRVLAEDRVGNQSGYSGTAATTIRQTSQVIGNPSGGDLGEGYVNAEKLIAEGGSVVLPFGSIILWHGAIADIPDGFALCDGNNGTPDLRDRFVVGAGNSYSVDGTGGEDTHTLTQAELPSANTSNTDPGGSSSFSTTDVASGSDITVLSDHSGSLDHSHNLGGSGNAHENRPPYYALAYIMRL